MELLNSEKEDFHLHSITFSDGFNSIDEIAQFAGTIGMRKLVITDHSQATLDVHRYVRKTSRTIIKRWQNVYNDVDVSFGVEADLLNENGDICDFIGSQSGDFLVLSYHDQVYQGDPNKVAEGFINALTRYKNKINLIGHVCLDLPVSEYMKVVETANQLGIPAEINARYFLRDQAHWETFLQNIKLTYINSDAHTLWELKTRRLDARKVLQERGLIK